MEKNKKNIVLGVSGGIAAYKAATLASGLVKNGYIVDTIMTKNAAEFITPLTFETLTHRKVVTDMFEKPDYLEVEHISLADKADMILVAPATYNIIGKIANGIADDMLTTVIAATKSPVCFALAMNKDMYDNPVFMENVAKLKKLGYLFLDAAEGRLACDENGKGRMQEPVDIISFVNDYFMKKQIMAGKKILITAGRTEEAIDPVRYISNSSTGKMGIAIAEAARDYGAEVTLILGKVSVEIPKGVEVYKITSAIEMEETVMKYYSDTDIAVMTAAVADYRPKKYYEQKIKKTNEELIIELVKNPDILLEMGKIKTNQFLVGFAAESENLLENAKSKLIKKNLDLIVANDASNFGKDTNKIFFIDKEKVVEEIEEKTKKELGFLICDEILKRLEKK